MKFSSGWYVGSGTLISKNVVLTCGHNLYLKDKKETPTVVKFAPASAFQDGKSSGQFFDVLYFCVHPQYMEKKDNDNTEFDLGLLALKDDLSAQYGYLGYESK